jgi:hypothetical protein
LNLAIAALIEGLDRRLSLRAEGKGLMAIAEILRAEGTSISHMGVNSALRA